MCVCRYPPELVQRVLNETKAVAVLTHEPHHVRLPSSQVSLIVDANGRWKDELQRAGYPRYDDPVAYPGRVDSTPDDLACVTRASLSPRICLDAVALPVIEATVLSTRILPAWATPLTAPLLLLPLLVLPLLVLLLLSRSVSRFWDSGMSL